ncbi:hypothetical protein [Herpetosiphon llansteffanensis]|uniref:hypothetical protein n=1 Tax=Herpetosiphon llansteffanensis TaxID=2094568 RepID=UPI000F51A3F2|nr:hypothetical protein [Herpetosiphon llansteffanensis]
MKNYPLPVALNIPSGWIVHSNTLFEVEPVLPDGSINREFNTSEDLIWIEQFNFGRFIDYITQLAIANRPAQAAALTTFAEDWAKQQTIAETLSLDVGWHYNGEGKKDASNGYYRLVLLRGGWEHVIYRYETTSTSALIEKINHCLNYPNHYLNPED